MNELDVIVVGSANLDLVARVERIPLPGETISGSHSFEAPGGKGLNQAVAASRSGARTALLASVGRDAAGQNLLAVMNDHGIDTNSVEISDVATGRAMIAVDNHAENSIVVIAGANAMLTPTLIEKNASLLARAAVVLAQLEIPLDSVFAAFAVARRAGRTTILNPAPCLRLPHQLLGLVDILVPNEHEVELLGGAAALLQSGIATVIVTEGARGARLLTAAGESRIASFCVSAIDSTAAGDSFCGGLAARLARGDELASALRWAAAAGALATTIAGAVPSIPDSRAIQAMMNREMNRER